ncbi:MAG: hypothetical protein M1839_008319 [Geoglossum umbratile]|nr:MAG: hypothetical protein M1839_008319 [Geoglossum umbratile]
MQDFAANLDSVPTAMKRSWRKESVFWLASSDNQTWMQSNAQKQAVQLESTDPAAFEEARKEYKGVITWHSYAIYFAKDNHMYIYDPSWVPNATANSNNEDEDGRQGSSVQAQKR